MFSWTVAAGRSSAHTPVGFLAIFRDLKRPKNVRWRGGDASQVRKKTYLCNKRFLEFVEKYSLCALESERANGEKRRGFKCWLNADLAQTECEWRTSARARVGAAKAACASTIISAACTASESLRHSKNQMGDRPHLARAQSVNKTISEMNLIK